MLGSNPSYIGSFSGNCFGKGDSSVGLILYIESAELDYYYILVMLNMS